MSLCGVFTARNRKFFYPVQIAYLNSRMILLCMAATDCCQMSLQALCTVDKHLHLPPDCHLGFGDYRIKPQYPPPRPIHATLAAYV